MKFAVLGFFGLLAVAAAYPYPEAEHPRYPVPSYAERYQWPEAPHDDNREFKGLVRALVQSMDQPETNHETREWGTIWASVNFWFIEST